jgi:membrane associated rhomboid family serine protease
MIPLGDASRRPLRSPVITALIIGVNVAVFLLELANGEAFILRWSLIPAAVADGYDRITILTAMFLHAGWMHILGNMVFLWAFGPQIEDVMGRVRYPIFYLLGGLLAFAAQILADPASTVPTLGASGAIAAVMGAFLITFPRDGIRTVLIIFLFVTVTVVPAAVLVGLWSGRRAASPSWLTWPASFSGRPRRASSRFANDAPRRAWRIVDPGGSRG